MPVSIACVDAFTDKPFAGNPAAVCLLDAPRDEGWMQQVAAEMNLAETAFLVAQPDGFGLRWFTPILEVDLCGHATLAAAHTLWTDGIVAGDKTIAFHSRSGILRASRRDGLIELDFPAEPARPMPAPPALAEALGAKLLWTGLNRMDWLVEVESETVLRALAPDFAALARFDVRGVIVTCNGTGSGFDFLSRFFAPGAGIPEDPVTGSAHCCLGPFWAERLGRSELRGFQASPRGGIVRVTVGSDRVLLGGHAVTVHRGTLIV